jgi:hypothetical protein
MSNKDARLRRLEQRWPSPGPHCPDCGTEPPGLFPLAFGNWPLCGTCHSLLTPDGKPAAKEGYKFFRRRDGSASVSGRGESDAV